MSGSTNGSFTSLLAATAEGDGAARSELWSAVYDELRGLAAALMARERADHTLQPPPRWSMRPMSACSVANGSEK